MTSTNQPILYFVGVGPGDPSLLTLKAVDLIKRCDVLLVPVRKQGATRSMALDVVKQAVDIQDKKIVFVPFPMVKGTEAILSASAPAVATVKEIMAQTHMGVFITLGCATIYSTAGNLFLALKESNMAVSFVPGISAINAAGAASGAPLVFSEENLVVLPATYAMDRIEACITQFDTIVLMKAHSNMDRIMTLVRKKGLENSAYVVEKASFEEEQFHWLADLPKDYNPHYMSTVIIKNPKEETE